MARFFAVFVFFMIYGTWSCVSRKGSAWRTFFLQNLSSGDSIANGEVDHDVMPSVSKLGFDVMGECQCATSRYSSLAL